MLLTAVLIPAPEGGYTATNPETGTTSQGESVGGVGNERKRLIIIGMDVAAG